MKTPSAGIRITEKSSGPVLIAAGILLLLISTLPAASFTRFARTATKAEAVITYVDHTPRAKYVVTVKYPTEYGELQGQLTSAGSPFPYVGKKIRVLYDPAYPYTVRLDTKFGLDFLSFLIPGATALLIGILMSVTSRRHNQNKKS